MPHAFSSRRSAAAIAIVLAAVLGLQLGFAPSNAATPGFDTLTGVGLVPTYEGDPVPAASRAAARTMSAEAVEEIDSDFEFTFPAEMPAAAKDAFTAGAAIWSQVIDTDAPVRVNVEWDVLGPGLLGAAGPTDFYANFGFGETDIWYPAPLANAMAGGYIDGEATHDVQATFSSDVPWYFGLDGNTPGGQYDLRSIVAHELGHGLGWINSLLVDPNTGIGSFGLGTGRPFRYDQFVETSDGTDALDVTGDDLADLLTGEDLFWANGTNPRLFAPAQFSSGSSIGHFDEASFSGNEAMMTPAVGAGEAFSAVAPKTLGVMTDMGWPLDGPAPTTTTTAEPTTSTTVEPTTTTVPVTGPLAVLETLQVEDEPDPRSGYDRDLFKHWSDLDGDGCDTREEVLITESLTDGTVDSRCKIVDGGTWTSLFDDVSGITNPSSLDIDHMVPLAEAWDSGADGWDADAREGFANDLEHSYALIAVSASSNRSKGDKDPAEWKPPAAGYHCQYATDWVSVKADWSLAVDAAEKAALVEMLETCAPVVPPTTTTTTTTTAPTTTSTTAPTTTSTTAPPTTLPPVDTDNDGVNDEDEPGDGNDDGTPDAEQAHVAQAAGHVIVVTNEASILVAESTTPALAPPTDSEFPLGFLTVTVDGPGPHQVEFFHGQGRTPLGVWVYDTDAGWTVQGDEPDEAAAAVASVRSNAVIGSASVTVEITEGGVGDIDGSDGDASLQAIGVAFGQSPVPPGGDTTTTSEAPGESSTSSSSSSSSSVPAAGDAGPGLVGDETTSPAATSTLPRTGSTTGPLTAAGLAAILLGVVFVAASARSRTVAAAGHSAAATANDPASRQLLLMVAALTIVEVLALVIWL